MRNEETRFKESSDIARIVLIIKKDTHVPANLINVITRIKPNTNYYHKIIITVFTHEEDTYYIEKIRPIILSNNRRTLIIYNKKISLENLQKCLEDSTNSTKGKLTAIFIDHELKNIIQYVKKLGYEINYLYSHNTGERKKWSPLQI